MKRIVITETQLKELVNRSELEVGSIDLAQKLKKTPCTGESIKSLIQRKIREAGYRDVTIKFLDYGENKRDLIYIVHTEGPVFVVTGQSKSNSNPPCMNIVDVIAYTKA